VYVRKGRVFAATPVSTFTFRLCVPGWFGNLTCKLVKLRFLFLVGGWHRNDGVRVVRVFTVCCWGCFRLPVVCCFLLRSHVLGLGADTSFRILMLCTRSPSDLLSHKRCMCHHRWDSVSGRGSDPVRSLGM
jgi:hypothetical protein